MNSNKNNPTGLIPVWTPEDFAETVAAANREQWWLSQGRERKARFMDGIAVTLLMATMAGLGACVYFSSVVGR